MDDVVVEKVLSELDISVRKVSETAKNKIFSFHFLTSDRVD